MDSESPERSAESVRVSPVDGVGAEEQDLQRAEQYREGEHPRPTPHKRLKHATMKSAKHIALVVVTVVIVGLAWKVSQDKAPQTDVVRNALYPELLERVNEVGRIELRSSAHNTVLVRSGERWQIENKDNYEAIASNVKRALLQVADLLIVEAKTRSSERYARLGLSDLDQEDAEGSVSGIPAA